MTEEKMSESLKKCPHFNGCNQNLCPLDLELHLRVGGESDKCRWMREPKAKKIKGREFISGGSVMPSAILNFAPESNSKRLNKSSQIKWRVIQRKN